jgi:phosphate transport system substrate-binding protein
MEVSSAAAAFGSIAAAEFMKHGQTRVSVGISGVARAFEKFCRGEIALVGVARPILKEEMEACGKAKVEFVELPVALDAFVLIVNPKNRFVENLSVEHLRRMWEPGAQGTITHWAQINARWPDRPLKLLGPARSSDEARGFNVAVLGNEFTRHDYMGSAEDRMLIEAVERDPHAIAYVALSAYVANRSRVRAVPVVLKAGANPVMPSSANVAGGAYSSLTRAIFIYVSTDALERRGVDAFAEHLARHAARLAKGADLVPLTDSIYQAGVSRLRARRAGSIWGGGTPVGLTMQALQRKFLAM